jgi:hypothetical protein
MPTPGMRAAVRVNHPCPRQRPLMSALSASTWCKPSSISGTRSATTTRNTATKRNGQMLNPTHSSTRWTSQPRISDVGGRRHRVDMEGSRWKLGHLGQVRTCPQMSAASASTDARQTGHHIYVVSVPSAVRPDQNLYLSKLRACGEEARSGHLQ